MCLGTRANYFHLMVSPLFLTLPGDFYIDPETVLVRGIGTSTATAVNWAANLLINSTYLSLMSAITPSGAFGFYAGLCLLGWIFCIFCYPETAGLSLEEVTLIFEKGFGLRKSEQLRRDKKRMREAKLGKDEERG